MIPILYEKTETAFESNGICRLADCISVLATEERNGMYEVEFKYPLTGAHFEEIQEGRIIACTHDEAGDIQPFEIYHRTEPINGVVTFYACHLSYRLNEITVKPFTASTCALAMQELYDKSITTNPFTFWTDKTTSASFALEVPKNIRNVLAGEEGSILDTFGGGEYEFDKFTVKLHAARGSDTDVEITYGKNLVDYENDVNYADAYNGAVPYWLGSDPENGDPVLVTISGWTIDSGHNLPNGRFKTIPLDLSAEFQEVPTGAQLQAAAASKVQREAGWNPKQNFKINFVPLWQTEEYEAYAPLQRLRLCDTAVIRFPAYGTKARAEVIKVVYNVLRERYDEMQLGDARATLAGAIAQTIGAATKRDLTKAELRIQSATAEAIADATALITGADGGYVVTRFNTLGQPKEILIMDNADIDQAHNVWRWNVNGFAHSSTGINGPYTTAITIDGKIVADFILAGTMSANLVRGGTFIIGGLNNGSGVLNIQTAGGTTILNADNKGISADYNNTHLRINRAGTRTTSYHSTEGLFNGKEAEGVALEGNLQFYHKHSTTDFDYETLDKSGWIISHYDYQYGGFYLSFAAGNDSIFYISQNSIGGYKIHLSHDTYVGGNFATYGAKSRLAETNDYGKRLMYCYETPTPMFGDIGEGQIGADGDAYVFFDPIFAETIERSQYQVFIQKYGTGDTYVAERTGAYFRVSGTPGLEFGWEIKAKQDGYSQRRLDNNDLQYTVNEEGYGASAADHIQHIAEERSL